MSIVLKPDKTNELSAKTAIRLPAQNARYPRRPLTYVAAAYITGIAFCYFYSPSVQPMITGLAVLAVGTAYSYMYAANHIQAPRLPVWTPFVLLLAAVFLTGAVYAHAAFSRIDPLELSMTDGAGYVEAISGRVLFAEQRDMDYRLLTVRADGRKLLVRQYGEKNKVMSPRPEMLIGKELLIQGELSYPDTARNPLGFDYRLYLLSQDIRIIVTCEKPGDIVVSDQSVDTPDSLLWSILGTLARTKAAFTERINTILPSEEAALFAGMIFGDKEAMDEETYDLFKRNGVAHILSVSGLHIGMVYAFVSAALGRRKTIRFYIIVLVLLLCYATLSNFSPSVMRAFSMIAVHIASKLLYRRYDMLTGVLFSALLMLVINPLALFGAGFLLSYTAVCSLSFALPYLNRHTGFRNRQTGRAVKENDLKTLYGARFSVLAGGRVLSLLLPSALIQIFILPVTAYFFNNLPLMAVFVNIPVIALSSLILPFGIVALLLTAVCASLPAFAFMLEPAADVGISSAGVLIDLMLLLTRASDAVPYSNLTIPSPPLPLLFLFYGVAYYLLSDSFAMNRTAILRLALPVIITLAILLTTCSPFGKQNDAPYTFVDVGQGDCLHIRTSDGRNYLMDGGGSYDYNVGKNVLAPYLLRNGVKKLDGIFVSHPHMDHFKGLTELAAIVDIGAIYVYDGHRVNTKTITHAFRDKGGDGDNDSDANGEAIDKIPGVFQDERLRYLADGDTVLLGTFARGETLFPPRRTDETYIREMTGDEDENRTSLIMRFENEGIYVLMTGDASKEGEAAVIAESKSGIYCDILKIGHHGSRTSTSDALLAAATPAAAVIQVGVNNYGHPAQETLEKLETTGIPYYRNDKSGAILIRPAPGGFAVQTMKQDLTSPVLLKAHEQDP